MARVAKSHSWKALVYFNSTAGIGLAQAREGELNKDI